MCSVADFRFSCRLFHSERQMTNPVCQVAMMPGTYHSNRSPEGMVGKVAVGETSRPSVH